LVQVPALPEDPLPLVAPLPDVLAPLDSHFEADMGSLHKSLGSNPRDDYLVGTLGQMDYDLAHARFGHINRDQLLQLRSCITAHALDTPDKVSTHCDSCRMCKATRNHAHPAIPITNSIVRDSLFHCDSGSFTSPDGAVVGGISERGTKMNAYFVFVEHVTGYSHIFFASNETAASLQKATDFFLDQYAKTHLPVSSRRRITLHSDGGPCYISNEFHAFCERNNIRQTFSSPHSPNENSVAERYTRTVKEATRSMLHHAQCPLRLWPYAMAYACFLRNRVPSRSLPGNISPYFSRYLHHPRLDMIRVFGSCAYRLKPQGIGIGHGFRPKAIKGIFLGIADSNNEYCWRVGSLATDGRLVITSSRNVVFNEDAMFYPSLPPSLAPPQRVGLQNVEADLEILDIGSVNDSAYFVGSPHVHVGDLPVVSCGFLNSLELPSGGYTTSLPGSPSPSLCSSTTVLSVDHHDVLDSLPWPHSSPSGLVFHLNDWDPNDPLLKFTPSHSGEVERLPPVFRDFWQTGQDDEWSVVKGNCTLVPLSSLPSGKVPLRTHFVYKLKEKEGLPSPAPESMSLSTYLTFLTAKCRCVFPGHREDKSSLGTTFAPTTNESVFRLLLSIFNLRSSSTSSGIRWILRGGDVSNAFCRAPLSEDKHVYILPPLKKYDVPGHCYRLRCPLYGMSEAPYLWNAYLHSLLVGLHWKQSPTEPCLYYHWTDGVLTGVLTVFVDDILFAGIPSVWDSLFGGLNEVLPFKDLGENPSSFLGVELTYTADYIYLSHTAYITELASKYGLTSPGSKATPAACDFLRVSTVPTVSVKEYQSKVGALLHVARFTRPDVSFAVKELTKHLLHPTETHMHACDRVIRYLYFSRYKSLAVSRSSPSLDIQTFTDADWASNPDTRRSTTGFFLSIDGLPIMYRSADQKSVSLSTCEAELFALSQGMRMVIYLRSLLLEMSLIPRSKAFVVQTDNQAAQAKITSQRGSSPQKHIDIRLKYLQALIEKGVLNPVWVHTHSNLADGFTKALPSGASSDLGTHGHFAHSVLQDRPCSVPSLP
jgi:hypothetical protein